MSAASRPLAVRLGGVINVQYQAGDDADTLRRVALGILANLPEQERASFTDAVEMCGLWLDRGAECHGALADAVRLAAQDDPRGEADR